LPLNPCSEDLTMNVENADIFLAWAASVSNKPVDPFLENARQFLLNEPAPNQDNFVSVFGDVEYNSNQGFTWAPKVRAIAD